MASLWDITSGLGKIAARKAAGEYYQQGFKDARAGNWCASSVCAKL